MGMEDGLMAKDHGSSVKDDKQYEGLRKKGMSKERAAKIANAPGASKKGRQDNDRRQRPRKQGRSAQGRSQERQEVLAPDYRRFASSSFPCSAPLRLAS
jgi:hypothetical protein